MMLVLVMLMMVKVGLVVMKVIINGQWFSEGNSDEDEGNGSEDEGNGDEDEGNGVADD